MKPKVAEKLKLLDALPGVYIMKNINAEIIYIGKAKNLINRVTQYFTRPHEGKTQKMVNEVDSFDFIITQSEKEALLLEMNLIHTHMPKYNILLKDGSSYPYIALRKKGDPYLQIARNTKDRKAEYFGPYPDASSAYEIIALLNHIFPLRKCKRLPKKPCLYYALGQCLAPCINQISQEQYETIIKEIRSFMKGNTIEVKHKLTELMQSFAAKLEYETANEYKKMLESIDYIAKRQSIIYAKQIDRDVFSFHTMADYISFATLIIRSGRLINCITQVLPLYGSKEDAFSAYIIQFYEQYQPPQEIIIPNFEDIEILQSILTSRIIVPKRGDNLQLIQMGAANAIKAMEEKTLLKSEGDNDINIVLEELKKRTNVASTKTIELIDNSHLQGEANVSAVVVFVNGVPAKKLYRKYKVAEENKANDFAAMHEILYRRYYRKLVEQQTYSDMLIVDGGLPQIKAAQMALQELMIDVPIFGLVKDKKHQTRALLNSAGQEIAIADYPPLFFLLTRMQDEVHRFVINYHRASKVKSMTSSTLDSIEGLGEKRKTDLLANFGTIEKITQASIDELAQYIPRKVAQRLKEKLT